MAQPYAWLFARGILLIDDRAAPSPAAGWIALHASKKIDLPYLDWARRSLCPELPEPGDFEHGGICGALLLTGQTVPCGSHIDGVGLERRAHFGGACDPTGKFFGLCGWPAARAFQAPFSPMPGKPGIFRIPEPDWWKDLPNPGETLHDSPAKPGR